jgi:hypothetical protein
MTDTDISTTELLRSLYMARTGEERFVMGARMFDAARAMVIASLPKDLSEREFREEFFRRIYGQSIEETLQPR